MSRPPVLVFGPYRLDRSKLHLYKDEVPLALAPKEFDTLRVLVENAGRVVSKEDLMHQVWPETYVSETSLTRNISVLRKILGPGYIETVPKRGYHFIASVVEAMPLAVEREIQAKRDGTTGATWSTTPVEVGTQLVPASRPASRGRTQRFIALAAVVVLIATVVLGMSILRRVSPTIRSISVVTASAAGANPDSEILAAGVAESVIQALRRANNIRVVAQHTPVAPPDAVTVARDLNTDAAVILQTERRGDAVHVYARMVDRRAGKQLWEEEITGPINSAAWVNSEVGEVVARRLDAALPRPTRQRTLDSAAFQDYLRGRYFWNKRSPQALEQAFAAFQAAIARDPNFALAYAGLAQVYAVAGVHDARFERRNDTYLLGRAAADRAIALDPQLAAAHAAFAQILRDYDRDMSAAEREYKQALKLDPYDATTHQWYAEYLSFNGRFDEAIAEIDRARELDPLSVIITAVSGTVRFNARRYVEGLAFDYEALRLDPSFAGTYGNIGGALEELGRYEEAFDAEMKAYELLGDRHALTALQHQRAAYRRGGARALWRERLAEALAEKADFNGKKYRLAALYCEAGDRARCLELLEDSVTDHTENMIGVQIDPAFDIVRDDPRYAATVSRLGFKPSVSTGNLARNGPHVSQAVPAVASRFPHVD